MNNRISVFPSALLSLLTYSQGFLVPCSLYLNILFPSSFVLQAFLLNRRSSSSAGLVLSLPSSSLPVSCSCPACLCLRYISSSRVLGPKAGEGTEQLLLGAQVWYCLLQPRVSAGHLPLCNSAATSGGKSLPRGHKHQLVGSLQTGLTEVKGPLQMNQVMLYITLSSSDLNGS